MTRKEGRKEGIDDPEPLPLGSLRGLLLAWIRRRVRNPATAEDLAQEALLHTIVSARRQQLKDARCIEKLAQTIARNLTASHQRQRLRKPATNRQLDDSAEQQRQTFDHTREELAALRSSLEPLLGPKQRQLLAAWLDDDVTSIGALATRLQSSPANVRRMLAGINKRIAKLTWADVEL